MCVCRHVYESRGALNQWRTLLLVSDKTVGTRGVPADDDVVLDRSDLWPAAQRLRRTLETELADVPLPSVLQRLVCDYVWIFVRNASNRL